MELLKQDVKLLVYVGCFSQCCHESMFFKTFGMVASWHFHCRPWENHILIVSVSISHFVWCCAMYGQCKLCLISNIIQSVCTWSDNKGRCKNANMQTCGNGSKQMVYNNLHIKWHVFMNLLWTNCNVLLFGMIRQNASKSGHGGDIRIPQGNEAMVIIMEG